jgi:hypothetical protein
MSDDSGIIEFESRAQRIAREDANYVTSSREEAVHMLEEALRFVRENPDVASVAIAYSFANGGYATQIPKRGNQIGALIGATAALTFKLNCGND